jgi:hypothetical protein
MELLEQVRQFLNITWVDNALDSQLQRFIDSSKDYLCKVAGRDDLDFNTGLANDLLLNRVLYMNSHNQNDFQVNYNAELNALRILNTTYEQNSNG